MSRPPKVDIVATGTFVTMGDGAAAGEADVWFETDQFGLILDCSDAGAAFLGYGPREARARSLLVLFLSSPPSSFDFARAALGRSVRREAMLRTIDRGPIAIRYRITAAARSEPDEPILRWTLEPL